MLEFITKADIWRQLDAGLHTELGWVHSKILLKTWQDMAVYERLRDATGLRIAEIGGGASRILPKLAEHNTCFNVDKFTGQHGGPKTEHIIDGVTNVPAYLGEYSLDLPDNSFDVVFSVNVVEHVPHTATVAFIDDLLRILKPGGVCYHAMSMYVGDTPDPSNVKKLETYAGWLTRLDVTPMEETTATQPLFQSNMGTNPDLTMWKWGQSNAALTEWRCTTQSVSLFMGFHKTGSALS